MPSLTPALRDWSRINWQMLSRRPSMAKSRGLNRLEVQVSLGSARELIGVPRDRQTSPPGQITDSLE